ncbi:hypothetical protein Tco_0445854, partial [Tanacetum coccineum]
GGVRGDNGGGAWRGIVAVVARYGYCKNLKKTVKTGQSRTRERN